MQSLACLRLPFTACVCLLILAASVAPGHGQTCHDLVWAAGEFCGRDAAVTTGATEMNHDCLVDVLDFALFANDYGLSGPNLSGDFDGNHVVNLIDFTTFASSFCTSVTPCTSGGMLPNECMGTIALSFSSDSTSVVSTTTQLSGRVHIVVDGWTNAQTIEFGIETSANVLIVGLPTTPYPYWTGSGGWGICDPDAQHSQRLYTTGAGTWPSGPINFSYLDYLVTDGNPAWLKLVPANDSSCWECGRLRWAQGASNRSFDFATVLNAGINGPAPPGETTCSEETAVPTTGTWAFFSLGILMLALALWAVTHREGRPIQRRT